jgi:hypothetical protein
VSDWRAKTRSPSLRPIMLSYVTPGEAKVQEIHGADAQRASRRVMPGNS